VRRLIPSSGEPQFGLGMLSVDGEVDMTATAARGLDERTPEPRLGSSLG
jgi:hypothetical protein